MSSRLLAPLLVLCGIIALTPSLMWASARLFDRVDDRWLEALGATGVTLPIALGLAALVLVQYGLSTNATLQQELAEEAEIQRDMIAQLSLHPPVSVAAGERADVTPAVVSTGPRTASVSASRRPADAPAVAEEPPARSVDAADPAAKKTSQLSSKGRKAVGRAATRGRRRATGKGKMAARRQMRETMREMRG